MVSAGVPLVAAPMLAFVLLVYVVRPVGPTVAPMRLAVICAALAVAAVTLPPGAEYLLTHLRLLAGTDAA